jgi:hypothetical protein
VKYQFDGACRFDKVIIFEADRSAFPYIRAVKAGAAGAAQVFDKVLLITEGDAEVLP